MKCFSPITLKQSKNGVTEIVHVPCGKCAACLSRERKSWQTRLELEARYSVSAKFVTLTYADQYLPYGERVLRDGEVLENVPVLDKVHCQNFFKRFREKNQNKIKYYLVGEYGEHTQRPHYHMLLFNADHSGDRLMLDLLESWQKGQIDVGTVTQKSISYVLGYMSKDRTQRQIDTVRLMSKGLGKVYADRLADWHLKDPDRNYIMTEDGKKVPIPRYLKGKIYNDFTRKIQAKKTESLMKEKREKFEEKYQRNNPDSNIFIDDLDRKKRLVKNQLKNKKHGL